jgi:hypothetical protein
VNIKKHTKTQQGIDRTVVAPKLVKATEVAARMAAQTEAERLREEQLRQQRAAKPPVRTPRNAIEARDMFNALFNEAA